MKVGRYQYDPVDSRIVDTSREPLREWLSTRDALEHLRLTGLSSDGNRTRLIQWAAAGLLPARALFLRDRERLPPGSLIPTRIWESVAEGLWVRSFDWQAGSLRLLRRNLGSDLDVEAHGIEFDKLSLLRLAPESAQTASLGPHATDRPIGRPTSTGPFSAADKVILVRMQELMDKGWSSPTAAARQLWVHKELQGQDEESAIKRVVRKFRKRP